MKKRIFLQINTLMVALLFFNGCKNQKLTFNMKDTVTQADTIQVPSHSQNQSMSNESSSAPAPSESSSSPQLPQNPLDPTDAADVYVSSLGHFCLLLNNGNVKCWGRNDNG